MHQPSNTRPLLCRELVGREHELEELREALQHAATSHPQFVMLAGEAGVGKTKLCRVFMEASQAQQALVLFGQAIPQDQTFPFGPFLDAFRRYFIASPGTLTTSDPTVVTTFAPLLRLLPEVAPLLPAVPSPPGGPSTPVQQQQALFHSILAGLQALAHTHRGPLLLVLEDLHWADETSLELLAFLAQRLAVNASPAMLRQTDQATALIILGTYRAEALPEAPALSRLLLQLHTQRQVQEMRLSPLPFSAHLRCVNSILEQPVPEELGRLLFDWDEGNPFFLEELLEAMAASGQLHLSQHVWHILPAMRPNLPPSITAAILERVERLQLLERLGMLSLGIFNFAEALYWLRLARAGYQRIGQPYLALQVLSNMHLPSWFLASTSLPEMLNELETAVEAIFADPQHANRGAGILVVSSRIATYRTYECQFHRAMYWIERSMALYESLSDPRKVPAMQLSFLSRGWIKANQHATVAEEGIAEIRNVLKAAIQYNLPDVILFSYGWLAWILIHWGRDDEAEEVLAEAIDFESRSDVPHPSFVVGWQRFFSGERWQQGIELLRAEMSRIEGANIPALAAIQGLALAHLLLARNELDEAERYIQNIQPTVELLDQYIYLTQLWWGLARLCVARGKLSQSQEWYERILQRWKTTEDTFTILPILLDGIAFYAGTGNRVKARQWLAELEAVVRVTENPVGVAALLEARGALKTAEGIPEEAIPLLRQAVEAWGNVKWLYQQALASQRLAEVLLTWASREDAGRAARQAAREEADRLLDQALAVYERLQIPTGIQAIQALRSSTHLEAQQKRRRTLATRQPVQGLTQREMQVLSQLAAGRTNREIATALSLSEGTVELHVSHIMAKLDCETRTQAAAYALAHGWTNNQLST